MELNKHYLLLAVLFLTACSGSKVQPLITLDAAAIKKLEMASYKNEFCTMGSSDRLGGMAKMPDAEQYSIGKCKPFKLDRANLIVLYFDDGTSISDYSDAELDAIMHPSEYMTNAEESEEACDASSNCGKHKKFLESGALVYFDVDSDSPLNVAELQRVAQNVRDKPTKIKVVGHADSSYTESHNNPLSVRRAKKVREILVSFGIPDSRISIEGRSSREPVAPNDQAEGRALNRRAEVSGVDNDN